MAAKTSSGASLEALKPLVGAWRLVATFKDMPPADIGARVTFAWLPGERFLIQRWEVPIEEAPDGIAIIGPDPARAGSYLQHYFDTRGVERRYGILPASIFERSSKSLISSSSRAPLS